jgi:glycerol uptake facilitator-like aquaporin
MFQGKKLNVLLAELIGTFMLASAVLIVGHMFSTGTAAWYISLTAGVTLALIVTKIGHVSGAHVNPAVTIGLWTQKRITAINAIVYIAAQILGGLLALSFYNYAKHTTLPAIGADTFLWRTFWLEAAGAAIFGGGIMAALTKKLEGAYAAFTIGLSLTAGALFASTAAPGFLNPAVALSFNALDKTTLVAPIVGMVVGMQVYSSLFAPIEKSTKKKK